MREKERKREREGKGRKIVRKKERKKERERERERKGRRKERKTVAWRDCAAREISHSSPLFSVLFSVDTMYSAVTSHTALCTMRRLIDIGHRSIFWLGGGGLRISSQGGRLITEAGSSESGILPIFKCWLY